VLVLMRSNIRCETLQTHRKGVNIMKRLHLSLLLAGVVAGAAVAVALGAGFGAGKTTMLAPAVWQTSVSSPVMINHGSNVTLGNRLTSVTLPSGEYILLAKLDLANHGNMAGSVVLSLQGPGSTYDTATVPVPVTHATSMYVPLMGAVRLATSQTIEVKAVAITPHSSTAVQANNIKLIAFSVNAFAA
jgi:hypothetical protein